MTTKRNKVWELFKNEFWNASRQLGGELGWMLVPGSLSVGGINKEMSEEIVAKLVANAAVGASSTVQFAASWASGAKAAGGKLADAGVLLMQAACYQVLPTCGVVVLQELLHKESGAHRKLTELVRDHPGAAVPASPKIMQKDHGGGGGTRIGVFNP